MKYNVVFVFSDQHRLQATGYAGDPNVNTPNMDRLREIGTDFLYAISNCPVCSPNRASLITGQYPLTHRVVFNDVTLSPDATSIAHAFKNSGYDTAYIGKWHLNGKGRSSYIPPEERLGFDFWRVLECTHNYNNSFFYGDDDVRRKWEGYDVFAQTNCAIEYIKEQRKKDKPFFLMLSWGPPHDPYNIAPSEYRKRFKDKELDLRPNVPVYTKPYVLRNLPGYYAHVEAIDDALGKLMDVIDDNTIFVYTSDHGDMLGSQGLGKKQKPYDESIRIPFLMKLPGESIKSFDEMFNTPDIAPTLLGLCGIEVPKTMEGRDLSEVIRGRKKVEETAAFIMNIAPFGEYARCFGGREWRGLRTKRHTYVISKAGPWLLFDNKKDPYQLNNLIESEDYRQIREELHEELLKVMEERNDDFLFGDEYAEMWGYNLDDNGTVIYNW
ncbi:MAG TPA: sulfatase [Clostridiaceae bacterium]|jgi:arylsulfatase A-like enzyme|nr:sulfatase [Clostridiaceae bacterium]